MQHFIAANPTWVIPADKEVGLFHIASQIALGDKLCSLLAKIIPVPLS